jgi:hypothetical protein
MEDKLRAPEDEGFKLIDTALQIVVVIDRSFFPHPTP